MSPVRNKNNGAGGGAADGVGVSVVGMSNLGNTSGTSGTVGSQLLFAGGNNITLSQSINGSSATITISGINTSQGSDTMGISNLGNTSGTSGTINGSNVQLILAGGNNITLSQSVNGSSATITISGINTSQGSDTMGISNLGNTSGTSGTINGSNVQLILAGGNNITLSQSVNGSSATITISGINTSQGSDTMGISNLGNTSGTSGTINGSNVQLILAGGNNITLSQSLNGVSGTITISAKNAGITESAPALDNGHSPGSTFGAAQLTQYLFPFTVPFNFSMTSFQHLLQITTTNSTFRWSMALGVYTKNVSTLSLLSSTSATQGYANTSNASDWNSIRLHAIPAAINLTPGVYWLGMHSSSAGTGSASWIVQSHAYTAFWELAGFALGANYDARIYQGFRNAAYTTLTPVNSIAISDMSFTVASNVRPFVTLATH